MEDSETERSREGEKKIKKRVGFWGKRYFHASVFTFSVFFGVVIN